jgi:hypothetical protein
MNYKFALMYMQYLYIADNLITLHPDVSPDFITWLQAAENIDLTPVLKCYVMDDYGTLVPVQFGRYGSDLTWKYRNLKSVDHCIFPH